MRRPAIYDVRARSRFTKSAWAAAPSTSDRRVAALGGTGAA